MPPTPPATDARLHIFFGAKGTPEPRRHEGAADRSVFLESALKTLILDTISHTAGSGARFDAKTGEGIARSSVDPGASEGVC